MKNIDFYGIGKGFTGLGISLAVAIAVYITKDGRCLWGLCALILVY